MARILPTGLAAPWQYEDRKIVQHTPQTQIGPGELKAIYSLGKTLWDEVISPNMAALIGAIVRANQAEGPDKQASVKEVNRLAAVMKASPKDMEKAKEAAAEIRKADPDSVRHKMGYYDPVATPEDLAAREERRAERAGDVMTFDVADRDEKTIAEENLFIDKLYLKFEDGSLTKERALNYLTANSDRLADLDYDIERIRQRVNSWWGAEALKAPSRSWSEELEAARKKHPHLDLEIDPESGEIKVVREHVDILRQPAEQDPRILQRVPFLSLIHI